MIIGALGELNSHPTVLIAAAVIELKTNKPNVPGIELTYAISEFGG